MKKLNWLILTLIALLFLAISTNEASAKNKIKRTSWTSEKPMIEGHSYVYLYFYGSGKCSMVIRRPGEDKIRHSVGTYEYKDNVLTLILSDKSMTFTIEWASESRMKLIGPDGDEDYFTLGYPEEECRHCGGGGGCESCHGSGERRSNYGEVYGCGLCSGTGSCYYCKGKGYNKL